eukprot:g81428.t1
MILLLLLLCMCWLSLCLAPVRSFRQSAESEAPHTMSTPDKIKKEPLAAASEKRPWKRLRKSASHASHSTMATLPVKMITAAKASPLANEAATLPSRPCALDEHLPGPLQDMIPGRIKQEKLAAASLPISHTPVKTERVLPALRTSNSALLVSQRMTGRAAQPVEQAAPNGRESTPIECPFPAASTGPTQSSSSSSSASAAGLVENQLFLLQFPLQLPRARVAGQLCDLFPPSAEDPLVDLERRSSGSAAPAKAQAKQQQVKALPAHPSGFVGKLLLRRSGALQLVMGKTIFKVQKSSTAACHQEVISIDAGNSTTVAVSLGECKSKKVCCLEFVHR